MILAAQRDGRLDPLAAEAGVTHKCLVPIGGRPLLAHVLEAFAGLKGIEAVRIAVEPGAESDLRPIADASGLPVAFVPSADTITDSVYAAAAGSEGPIVVTTADNVLLTPAAVREVAARLEGGDDMVVALARKEDVLSAHPEGQRRFYKFRDGEFSNCNLYGLSHRGLETRRDLPRGRPVRQESDADRARLRLSQPDPLRYGLISLDSAMRAASAGASACAPRRWCWPTAPMRSTSTMPAPTASPPSFSTGAPPESYRLCMAEFTLPKNSKIRKGRAHPAPDGAKRTQALQNLPLRSRQRRESALRHVRGRSRQLRADGPRRADQDQVASRTRA